jgi:hypothetical protein
VPWAYLNAKGKRYWGDIFPDGKVPIQSIAAQQARVDGLNDPESIFAIDWKALSERQQQAILKKLTIQKGTPKSAVLKGLQSVGLPLQRKHIQSMGTDRMQLYF